MTKSPVVARLLVARRSPVVLIAPDAQTLGQVVATSPDDDGVCLLAVMVGDPDDPHGWAAAEEMARELGGRTRAARPGTPLPG